MSALERVYQGENVVNISHAGGELEDLEKATGEELMSGWRRRKRRDKQTHRDQLQVRVKLFDAQMPASIQAYMEWAAKDGGN
ncbi:hypothetical protein L218DRAFT_1009302 [Marasmius fiardii PR-910]|nr:hypothetical protein L218DRAFT_1009302 [Marasmius fiardii PR-910]